MVLSCYTQESNFLKTCIFFLPTYLGSKYVPCGILNPLLVENLFKMEIIIIIETPFPGQQINYRMLKNCIHMLTWYFGALIIDPKQCVLFGKKAL